MLTARTVAVAAADRLNKLAHDPALPGGPSSFKEGAVCWNLTFVRQHTNVIRELINNPQADSGPDWFPAISPAVVQAFDSIQTILNNLDTRAAGRSISLESWRYWIILLYIEDILDSHCGSTLITSTFFGSLAATLSHLIGEDDWRNSHCDEGRVPVCKEILLRLESQLSSMPKGTLQPGLPVSMSAPSQATPQHEDQVIFSVSSK